MNRGETRADQDEVRQAVARIASGRARWNGWGGGQGSEGSLGGRAAAAAVKTDRFADPGRWRVRKEIKWNQWAGKEDSRDAQADLGWMMR